MKKIKKLFEEYVERYNQEQDPYEGETFIYNDDESYKWLMQQLEDKGSKVKTLDYLKANVPKWKADNQKIITTNGAFDLIHKGHIYVFNKCRSMGGVVIVGVNSDESIKQYKKSTRPINCLADRLVVLEAIDDIDYLCVFEETTPLNFLKAIQPDFHVKSKEGYKGIEEQVLPKEKIILLDDIPNYSSTKLFQKLFEDLKQK